MFQYLIIASACNKYHFILFAINLQTHIAISSYSLHTQWGKSSHDLRSLFLIGGMMHVFLRWQSLLPNVLFMLNCAARYQRELWVKGGGAFVAKRDIFAQKGWKRENAKWIMGIKTMHKLISLAWTKLEVEINSIKICTTGSILVKPGTTFNLQCFEIRKVSFF